VVDHRVHLEDLLPADPTEALIRGAVLVDLVSIGEHRIAEVAQPEAGHAIGFLQDDQVLQVLHLSQRTEPGRPVGLLRHQREERDADRSDHNVVRAGAHVLHDRDNGERLAAADHRSSEDGLELQVEPAGAG
jgi:hypothetical protein